MEVIQIESWADLAKKTDVFRGENWIFRGVRYAAYRLIPKIGREYFMRNSMAALAGTGGEIHFNFEAEKRLLEQFKRVARPHIPFEPKSDIEWLAVAQHHGLPTRFLDWSESPFVAAYFTVREQPIHDTSENIGLTGLASALQPISYYPGCIYAIRTPDETNIGHEQDPFSISKEKQPRLFRPPHISPRVPVQNAVLTLHNAPDEPWEPDEIIKLEIPGKSFEEIKSALNAIGFNEASQFPDLDGIGRHLGWLFEQDLN